MQGLLEDIGVGSGLEGGEIRVRVRVRVRNRSGRRYRSCCRTRKEGCSSLDAVLGLGLGYCSISSQQPRGEGWGWAWPRDWYGSYMTLSLDGVAGAQVRDLQGHLEAKEVEWQERNESVRRELQEEVRGWGWGWG